jgi:hypothetical protein
MFPVNYDLATTGNKLQGMTKKFLIVSSINYNTANWIYVVLSRVTSLDGLFLMQPLKPNFNPKPTKLLQQEWMFQRHLEKETLLHLQKFGNFPVEIDLTTTDAAQSTDVNGEKSKNVHKSLNSKIPKKTTIRSFQLLRSENGNNPSPTVHSFDLWLSTKKYEENTTPNITISIVSFFRDPDLFRIPADTNTFCSLMLPIRTYNIRKIDRNGPMNREQSTISSR